MNENNARAIETPDSDSRLMLDLLQGFYWFDEGLQNYLRSRGWPVVTRPQSMVMANVVSGCVRPSDIARRLGISRQAIHNTLKSMIDLDMIALVDDPAIRRAKIVSLTPNGEQMRKDAQAAIQLMRKALSERLGAARLAQLGEILERDWGPPLDF